MPTRPAIHQPTFAKTPGQREAAERERQRRKDAGRPSSTERGYGDEWRKLRAAFIAEHPVCCVAGCGKPTVDVDHIERLRDHPERRLDPAVLRPMCHAHHAQHTARTTGFAGRHNERGGRRVSTHAALHPDWLRPSRVPLRIVCGPPAAGKAAYVAEHASFTELTLDLDEIRATLSGQPIFQPGYGWLNEAIRRRNAELGKLSSPYVRLGGAWLIVPAPRPETRQWWRDRLQPLSVIVLATPAATCHARIDADPRRHLVRDQHHAAVESWWAEYQPTPGDRVQTG